MKQMETFVPDKITSYFYRNARLRPSCFVHDPLRLRCAELEITLERNSPVPLYYQLAQAIEHAINTGALAPGDRLENELSLTSRLGLSRPTARQAIQELVKKGLLVRKRGVGTQVVRSQFRRTEALSSLNDDIIKAGKAPSTRLLEFSVGGLEEQDVRDAIEAAAVPETEFIKIRRLRLADEMPLASPHELSASLVSSWPKKTCGPRACTPACVPSASTSRSLISRSRLG